MAALRHLLESTDAASGDQFDKFSNAQKDSLQAMVISSTTFSLVFIMLELVVFMVLLSRNRPLGPLKLWGFLAIADLISCTANFLGIIVYYGDYDSRVCMAQGFIMQFGNMCCVLWTLAIAHNTYLIAAKADLDHARWHFYYHLSWPISLVSALVVVPALGPAGNWCWISNLHDGQLYRLTYYIPELLCFGVSAFVLIRGHLLLRRAELAKASAQKLIAERRRALHRRMLMLLFIYVVCYLSSIILRASQYAGVQIYGLAALQAVTQPLSGGLNALLLLFVRRIRHDLTNVCPCWGRIFACCDSHEGELPLVSHERMMRADVNTPLLGGTEGAGPLANAASHVPPKSGIMRDSRGVLAVRTDWLIAASVSEIASPVEGEENAGMAARLPESKPYTAPSYGSLAPSINT